jgi:hypothetical protein
LECHRAAVSLSGFGVPPGLHLPPFGDFVGPRMVRAGKPIFLTGGVNGFQIP